MTALLLGLATPAAAQNLGLVVRDGSLGSGPLEVGPGTDSLGQPAHYLITPELGQQNGANLFHSFLRFSIGPNETATFTGPDGIEHVISRVTGGEVSQIDGTLRSTIPGADVWLLNPSGVVFGAGAVLEVPGSFHASTADYLGFDGGLERYYADPTLPSVLATARPAAFGFLPESNPAALAAFGNVLSVPDGETLELVGGDITVRGAELVAPVGTISLRGGRIVVEQDSQVLAENEGTGPGGRIDVAASESVLVDGSLLSVSTNGAGDAGTIRLGDEDHPIPLFTMQNGAGLPHGFRGDPYDPTKIPHATSVGVAAETRSSGAGGTIEVDAQTVEITSGAGLSAQTVGAVDANGVPADASGAGGTIVLRAGSLRLANRGFISAESWGSRGNAGMIDISADSLAIDALDLRTGGQSLTPITAGSFVGPGRYPTAVTSVPETPAGAGKIVIEAGVIEIKNGDDGGGQIAAECSRCAGGAGEIWITAREMSIDGAIWAHVINGSSGAGGYIEIDAGSLVSESGWISAETRSEGTTGNGGTIVIHAGSMTVRGGIMASTWDGSSGDAGTIEVDAGSLIVNGGGLNVTSFNGSSGDAGEIRIVANSILMNGGEINAGTMGTGNGGRIAIDAGSLTLDGGGINAGTMGTGNGGRIAIDAGSLELRRSSITANALGPPMTRVGNAGDIDISGDTVRLTQGGDIQATSVFGGSAGAIQVTANDSILLDDQGGEHFSLVQILDFILYGGPFLDLTGIFSSTVEGGEGGSISLSAPEITINDGALVATTTIGGGAAGSIALNADRIRILNGGVVDTSSIPFPSLDDPGGDAGSIEIHGRELIEVIGERPEFDDSVSRVSSTSLGSGNSGHITLDAPRIVVDDRGVVATIAVPYFDRTGLGGGGMTITADDLVVSDEGRIDASTFIPARGGSIDVTARNSIRLSGWSDIATRTGAEGNGGDIALRAPRIEIANGASVSAESGPGGYEEVSRTVVGGLPPLAPVANPGDAGSITLAATDRVHLDAGEISTSVGPAAGGDIAIDPTFVILENGSRIVSTASTGTGGRIRIATDHFFAFPGTVVSAASGNPELSGTVEIHSPDVNLAGTLAPLPSGFLDASSLMRERCAARNSERAGSFAVRGTGGIPAEPDGWLPAPLQSDAVSIVAAPIEPRALVASHKMSEVADVVCP